MGGDERLLRAPWKLHSLQVLSMNILYYYFNWPHFKGKNIPKIPWGQFAVG